MNHVLFVSAGLQHSLYILSLLRLAYFDFALWEFNKSRIIMEER
jgi:hypothetical protein